MDGRGITFTSRRVADGPQVLWTSRDHRYRRKNTMRVTNPSNDTMSDRIRTFCEISEYRHYRHTRRTKLEGSNPTSTRVRRDLTLGACRPDAAHRGPAYGATLEAARSADSARTGHRAPKHAGSAYKTSYTQRFLTPGSASLPEGRTEPTPICQVHTAPSVQLSCGAIGGPVFSESATNDREAMAHSQHPSKQRHKHRVCDHGFTACAKHVSSDHVAVTKARTRKRCANTDRTLYHETQLHRGRVLHAET